MTRRQFQFGLGSLVLAPAAARPAITRVTKGGMDLATPPGTARGETWHYQIVLPFQVAARKAGVFCNVRKAFAPGVDFENGTDVILFDDLSKVSAAGAVPVTRNHQEPNPNAGGRGSSW